MSAVTQAGTPSIRSVTIIRQDVLPDAGAGIQAAARLARFAQSIAVLMTPLPTPDKVRFDVTDRQRPTFEWDTTENPIQDGSTITDHVRKLPEILEVEGIITDTPLFPPIPIQLNRAHREWLKLFEIAEAREPVFVATSLKVYPSMIIRRLSPAREVGTGGAIAVSMTLKEIRISRQLVEIPLIDPTAAATGANAATDGGTQVATGI